MTETNDNLERQVGYVCGLTPTKNYGFIRQTITGGADLFMHYSHVTSGTPRFGARCTYLLGADRHGRLAAVDVQIEG